MLRSTIGAGGLNCRVRDGNGCGPAAIITGLLFEEYGAPVRLVEPAGYVFAQLEVLSRTRAFDLTAAGSVEG